MFGNNKPFGTASAFGGNTFGSTTTPFGQPAASTAFGAKPATGNVFGASTFGSQSGGGLFGNTAPTTSTGLFGQTSTAFGQPAPTTGSFAFGANPSTSTGLFGATAPATQNAGLFGGSSTSAFGSPRPAFGGFAGTSTSTGLFGQNTNAGTGLFGTTGGFAPTATNGTTIKFNPLTGTDTMMKAGVTQNINTRHQCITCMKEYENKSLEELRLEDYTANRKGPQSGSIGGFGAPASQPGLFGTSAASTSGFSFGTQQNKPLFGTATGTTNTFGGTGAGLFGGQPAQQQNAGIFGKSVGFGTATTSAAPNFSFGNAAGTSLFGQTNQQKPLFGQPTSNTGLFGQPATTQATGFGTGTGFGAFGATSQPSVGLFGAKPTGTATTNTFSFGNTATNTGGLFGQKPATAFGTNTGFGATNTFGAFGNTATSNTGLFGQNKPAVSGFGTTNTGFGTGLGTGFGASPFTSMGMNTSTGTGLFGSSLTTNKPTFNFSGAGNTGFNFGQPSGTGTGFSFGGSSVPLAGSNDQNQLNTLEQQLQARQICAFTSNPFGDNPLFQISMKDSKKREEVLKPTNPAAQKAVLSNSHYKISPSPSAKVKPKPLTPSSSTKISLFDGLEDEDPSLGSTTFVPKRSVKKLVMKSQSNSSSFTVMSNITAGRATEISFSTSIILEKSPPVLGKDDSKGDSIQISPLTVNIGDQPSLHQLHKQTTSKVATSEGFSENSYTKRMLPNITKSSSEINLNDTIEALHTKSSTKPQMPLTSSSDSPKESFDPSMLPLPSSPSPEREPEQTAKLEPAKKHGTGITLSRKGYYTIPSMDQLLHMIDDDGSCVVRDFVVGQEDYGKVCFLGVLNVANLNLDEIVSFRSKEITVYPDDEHKPPVGVELNREAEVTLECVWPTDKTTHLPIKDPNRLILMGYQERIEKTTVRLGARFVDYNPDTGSWVFRVDHFSKYGLEDSDDEDDLTDPKLLASSNKSKGTDPLKKIQQPLSKNNFSNANEGGFKPKAKQLKISAVEDDDDEMQDADSIPPGDNVFSPLQHFVTSGMDAERIQGMKASFFLDDSDDKWEDDEMEVREPISHFGPMKGVCKFPKPVPVRKSVVESMDSSSFVKNAYSYVEEPKTLTSSTMSKMNSTREQPKLASMISAAREEIWSAYPAMSPVSVSPPKPSVRMGRPDVNRTVSLRPYEQSLMYEKQKCLADMGFFMGRSFRIGWGSKCRFLHLGQVEGFSEMDNVAQNCSVFSTVSLPKKDSGVDYKPFSISVSKIEVLNDVPVDKLIKGNLIESLEVQLEHCKSFVEEGTPIFVPNPGIEGLHAHASLSRKHARRAESTHGDAAFLKQCNDVWELCVALWGEIPGLESDRVISTYAQQMARREALSNWLIKTTKEKATSEINSHNYNPNSSHLSTIFSQLSVREVAKAVLLAQESGDSYLATILAQAEGNAIVRRLVGRQLLEWEKSEAYCLISPQRLKLYCLLAGVMIWSPSKMIINCCEGVDWRRTLALHLWYCCLPTADLRDVVAEYENSFSNADPSYCYAGPPVPPYQEGNDGDDSNNGQHPVLDTCFHLLKLYCDRSYRLDKLLMPEASTPAHMDYRLSWLLHQQLAAVGYCHLPAQESCCLNIDFATQLEAIGLWHWAVFVNLHFSCPYTRTKLVKDLLFRHVSLDDSELEIERECFLQYKLLIPAEWIYQAKAVKARSFGQPAEEAWFLLKAGCWSESHKIVLTQLAADAIINEDFYSLLRFLNELSVPERSKTILDWACGGQVFLDYIHVSQMVDRVVKGKVNACDVEKLQPEVVSLCHRLSSLQCRSAKDRLCQSEMAKKTATLLRSIFTFHADRSGNPAATHTLIPHIKSLPMPEDYALQELRALTRSYFTAVASGIN